ncbi:TIGR02466 family protein [Kitasatospora sp. NPDC001574]
MTTRTGAIALWPTPIYEANQAELTDEQTVARMNRELREIILDAEAKDAGAFTFGTIGAQKSSIDILRWDHPAVDWLRGRILAAVRDLNRDTLGDLAEKVTYPLIAEGWAVVYHQGASHQLHTHHDSVWSGTYYISTGGVDQDLAGHLQMIDPRPAAIARHIGDPVHNVAPYPGLLVAFPSWLPHSVRATLSEGSDPRICVAFNVGYDLTHQESAA